MSSNAHPSSTGGLAASTGLSLPSPVSLFLSPLSSLRPLLDTQHRLRAPKTIWELFTLRNSESLAANIALDSSAHFYGFCANLFSLFLTLRLSGDIDIEAVCRLLSSGLCYRPLPNHFPFPLFLLLPASSNVIINTGTRQT